MYNYQSAYNRLPKPDDSSVPQKVQKIQPYDSGLPESRNPVYKHTYRRTEATSTTKNGDRKHRTFSNHQIIELEAEFDRDSSLPRARCRAIAARLEANEKSVKNWFRNKRQRRRDRAEKHHAPVQPQHNKTSERVTKSQSQQVIRPKTFEQKLKEEAMYYKQQHSVEYKPKIPPQQQFLHYKIPQRQISQQFIMPQSNYQQEFQLPQPPHELDLVDPVFGEKLETFLLSGLEGVETRILPELNSSLTDIGHNELEKYLRTSIMDEKKIDIAEVIQNTDSNVSADTPAPVLEEIVPQVSSIYYFTVPFTDQPYFIFTYN